MTTQFRIISIGTLSSHPLWDDPENARTGHATTTLISTGDSHVLVDPSLPPQVLQHRMSERTPIKPEEITHVFLTSFEPERRRSLHLFEDAIWHMHEPEIAAANAALTDRVDEAHDVGDEKMANFFRDQLALLQRIKPAPDEVLLGIDLFPLPGVTPGSCGLLLPLPGMTVLICGDAIATSEHLEQGKVLSSCFNLEQSQESFREAVEIADIIIPGRDNLLLNPLRRAM